MAVSKLVLIGSGVGVTAATAGGVAFYLTSGETIVEHLSKETNLKNQKFIALVSDAEVHLQKKYSSSQEQKPTKDSKPIDKIVDWCKESENIKFSNESDPNYKLIAIWCFVDTTSLSEKAKQSSKKDIVGNDGSSEGWKEAWNTYNTKKETDKLVISTDKFPNLNKQEKDPGAIALYEWCKEQKDKKMYEENSEDTYKKYEKWCFQQTS